MSKLGVVIFTKNAGVTFDEISADKPAFLLAAITLEEIPARGMMPYIGSGTGIPEYPMFFASDITGNTIRRFVEFTQKQGYEMVFLRLAGETEKRIKVFTRNFKKNLPEVALGVCASDLSVLETIEADFDIVCPMIGADYHGKFERFTKKIIPIIVAFSKNNFWTRFLSFEKIVFWSWGGYATRIVEATPEKPPLDKKTMTMLESRTIYTTPSFTGESEKKRLESRERVIILERFQDAQATWGRIGENRWILLSNGANIYAM